MRQSFEYYLSWVGLAAIAAGIVLLFCKSFYAGAISIIAGIILFSAFKGAKKNVYEVTVEMDNNFSIAGINKMGVNDSFLGDFNGIDVAEDDNPYDPNAVSIWVRGKKVGYIPKKDSLVVHQYILQNGGQVPCEGFITQGEDDDDGHLFYWGKVSLLQNDCK